MTFLISRLHKDLKIPEGYYRAGTIYDEPTAPALSATRHASAMRDLGIESWDAGVARMCERINAAIERREAITMGAANRKRTPDPNNPSMQARMRAYLLENPKATANEAKSALGVLHSQSYYHARKQLRKEGKLR